MADTIPKTVVGAWREALSETGYRRVLLVLMVGLMTIPFAPMWVLLAVIEAAGFYSLENGFQLQTKQ